MGELDPRDIVAMARRLGVAHVDLVNILWFGHAQDAEWLRGLSQRARDHDVAFVCLMCDQLGHLGSSDPNQRMQAIENHKPWLACAAELGCTQVRVNAYGDGTYLEQLEQNAESIASLAELAEDQGVELLVENHGHPSSNAAWLAMLIEKVAHPNLGVYADLDNFFMGGWNIIPERRYDRLQGLLDLAPYTRGISAKTHAFTDEGRETTIDYVASMKVFLDHGFAGFASAEYEGSALSEYEGTQATIALLEATRKHLG
ncbi:MAG: sugar phosphate isomerase/epimerase family protein [Bacteroidota bacterium]